MGSLLVVLPDCCPRSSLPCGTVPAKPYRLQLGLVTLRCAADLINLWFITHLGHSFSCLSIFVIKHLRTTLDGASALTQPGSSLPTPPPPISPGTPHLFWTPPMSPNPHLLPPCPQHPPMPWCLTGTPTPTAAPTPLQVPVLRLRRPQLLPSPQTPHLLPRQLIPPAPPSDPNLPTGPTFSPLTPSGYPKAQPRTHNARQVSKLGCSHGCGVSEGPGSGAVQGVPTGPAAAHSWGWHKAELSQGKGGWVEPLWKVLRFTACWEGWGR